MVEHTVWIDQILRIEYSTAVVALVSPSGNVVAIRAFAFYEPVRQEAFVVLAIREDNILFENIPVLVQDPIEFLDEPLVNRTLCPSIIVELDVESFDAACEDSVILVG